MSRYLTVTKNLSRQLNGTKRLRYTRLLLDIHLNNSSTFPQEIQKPSGGYDMNGRHTFPHIPPQSLHRKEPASQPASLLPLPSLSSPQAPHLEARAVYELCEGALCQPSKKHAYLSIEKHCRITDRHDSRLRYVEKEQDKERAFMWHHLAGKMGKRKQKNSRWKRL